MEFVDLTLREEGRLRLLFSSPSLCSFLFLGKPLGYRFCSDAI